MLEAAAPSPQSSRDRCRTWSPERSIGRLRSPLAAAAADVAEPVVLSPACASFDQYRNVEVPGDAFRALVLALPGLAPAA